MRLAWILIAASGLLVACGEKARATPRDALEALRATLTAGDGAAFYDLLDSESAAFGRGEVRERRARLERGEEPAAVLKGLDVTIDELKQGREEDVMAKFFPRHSPLFKQAKWFAAAKVVEERQESPESTWLDLHGEDGVDHGLWFVLEGGSWRFDQLRTRKDW